MRISLIVLLAALVSACAAPAAPAAPADQRLTVEQVQVETGRLAFAGATSLPDETCLLTQVVIQGAVAPDWPVDCVHPAQGRWQLAVAVGQRGQPPQPLAGPAYEFIIWARDLPALSVRQPFDLTGPAAPR